MKKLIALLLLVIFSQLCAFAEETELKAPVWEEYVAPKYRAPRSDITLGGAIAETVAGDVLVATIFGAPLGIPLVVHGVSKIKMVSYRNRKKIFDKLIKEANLIEDEQERALAYKQALERCHLKEKTRLHYAKKAQKAALKAQKRQKQAQNLNDATKIPGVAPDDADEKQNVPQGEAGETQEIQRGEAAEASEV